MGSFFRFLGAAVLILILGVVAAAAIFLVTFDPNDLKAALVEGVAEETGRELTIEGDLDVSVFPYIGFSMGPTRLADAEGFGEAPFLSFEAAAASVRVLPLLTRSIEVGELRLEGFRLNAVTAADGSNNWDDLAALAEAEAEAEAEGPAPEGDGGGNGGGPGLKSLAIGSIVFRDARLRYEDRQQGATYEISDWNLTSGSVRLGEPVDLETRLDFTATNPDLAGRIEAGGRLTPGGTRTTPASPNFTVALRGTPVEGVTSLDLSVTAEALEVDTAGPFSLNAPTIRVAATGAALPEDATATVAAARLAGNLSAETLSLDALEAEALGIRVVGGLSGENILSGPRMSGSIEIREFSPKAVAERAGAPLTPTIDPQALTSLALSGSFSSTPTSLSFDDVVLELDDTTLEGSLAVADFERQALRFDLSADSMTLDRYMAPASEEPAAQENAGSEAAIPAEEIRGLDIDGTLKVAELVFGGLTSTNVQVTVRAADGELRIHPSRADMYGGSYEGDVRIDASGEVPTLSLNEQLKGVDFGALGEDVFDNRQLTGALDGRITVTGTGVTQSAILATLNGDAVFSFADGAILGVDIPFELQRALAALGRGSAPEGASQGRTEFAELSGTANIEQGVVRNDDLIVRLPFMLGTGEGTVDLQDDSLRYRLDLQFQKSPELPTGASEFVGISFPVLVTGTLGEPALDLGDMAAAIARDAAEEAVEKEVEKVRERVLGEAGKALGGLFGGSGDDDRNEGDGADAEPAGETQDEEKKKDDPLGEALRGLRKKIDE